MIYVMQTNATTTGKISGRRHIWWPGREIIAPPGEFAHIENRHYITKGDERAELPPPMEVATKEPGDPEVRPGLVNATPGARSLAAEHGVDLNQVAGSGAGGKVVKGDVQKYLGG